MTITHPHRQRKSISMTDQNDASQYGMLHFPLKACTHWTQHWVICLGTDAAKGISSSTALPSVLLWMLLPVWRCRIIYCVLFFVFFYTGFHHCLKLFRSKMYVNLTAIVYLLSKCSANVLLCNTIRLVEKLPVALLWSLMKLLTCLTSKQEQQMWVYVCVCARVRAVWVNGEDES